MKRVAIAVLLLVAVAGAAGAQTRPATPARPDGEMR
jgi:hypothetical protein